MKHETLELTAPGEEIIIFHDQKKEAAYVQWLNQFNNKIGKLSNAYNAFAAKIGIKELFGKRTLTALNGNPENWATDVISSAIEKVDAPLKASYQEHYWKEFNEMKSAIRDVFFVWQQPQFSTTNTIPGELFSLKNLPEIINGQFDISDEFLTDKKKYFETSISTDSRAYNLLNQMKEVYEELYSLGREKGLISAPPDFGRGAGLQDLASMELFLIKRCDETITINDHTLKMLQ